MRISQRYAHALLTIRIMRMETPAVRSPMAVDLCGLRCEVVMATGYIPTVGEYAERILDSFATLQAAAELPPKEQLAVARSAGIEFVRTCLGLLRKFPIQARCRFSALLPFTNLEMELISRGNLDESPTADAIAERLLGWVSQNPAVLKGRYAQPADFIRRLAPLLDLWDSRQRAIAVAEELVGI